MEVIIAEFRAA
jgi:hypothetical protein